MQVFSDKYMLTKCSKFSKWISVSENILKCFNAVMLVACDYRGKALISSLHKTQSHSKTDLRNLSLHKEDDLQAHTE